MISNCVNCGQMFMKTRDNICPACIEEKEEVFRQVKQYLRENKSATLVQVIQDLQIEMELVVEMVEEGRLYFAENPNFGIECVCCGKPTSAGRYCPSCQSEVARKFADATLQARCKSQDKKRVGGYFSRGR